MLKKIRIAIKTTRTQLDDSLFDLAHTCAISKTEEPPEVQEFTASGSYYDDGTRISIAYREGELTDMENTRTTLSFQKSDLACVTMTRDGAVRCTLLFEAGHLHTCTYQTPYMPFSLAVKTNCVENRIEESGILLLDYTAQLKGAQAQHTTLSLTLLPND